MTAKLSDEQRRILQRMAEGQRLVMGRYCAYRLVINDTFRFRSGGAGGPAVRGLIKRGLIVLTGSGYELSPAGRKAEEGVKALKGVSNGLP